MRIYDEIRRRRGADPDLCAELRWRIERLCEALDADADLADPANKEAFSEILDAYAPTGFRLLLIPDQPVACVANREAGGKISFSGFLTSDAAAVATISRTVWLAHGLAEHHGLWVVPRYRGNRLAPRSLVKCVALYDNIGLKEIRLRAAHSGRWYWAQWGFHFVSVNDLIRLQRHTQRIVDAFGADLDVSSFTHPIQFVELGYGAEICLDDLIAAFPHEEDALEEMAYENGIGRHRPIPFGRAVLLTGPSWDACLSLAKDGVDRLIFDDMARRVVSDEFAESG